MNKIFRGKSIRDYKEKNINEGDWIYGYYFYNYCKYLISFITKIDLIEYIEIDPETLGQLVYKKDNIKLFEGDIIEVVDETIKGDILINGVIDYDESDFCYILDFPQYGCSRSLMDFVCGIDSFNLKGNEFDNPDLLK